MPGQPREIYKKFLFHVIVGGNGAPTWRNTGFMKCTSPKLKIGSLKYREGGALVPEKQAGLAEWEPVTLSRGETADRDMYDWALACVDSFNNKGVVEPRYKRQVTIVRKNRAQTPIGQRVLWNAFITEYTMGDSDNMADEYAMEEIVVDYEFAQ